MATFLEKLRVATERIKQPLWIRRFAIGLTCAALGGVATTAFKQYVVERADVSIEIISIEREVSSSAKISLLEDPAFHFLRNARASQLATLGAGEMPIMPGPLPAEFEVWPSDFRLFVQTLTLPRVDDIGVLPASAFRVSVIELRQIIELATILPESINALKRNTQESIRRLKEFPTGESEVVKNEVARLVAGAEAFVADLDNTPEKIRFARARLDEIEQDFLKDRAIFRVKCVITNSGRRSATVLGPSVLYVKGNDGRVAKLRANLDDANLAIFVIADGTATITLVSDETRQVDEATRRTLEDLWKSGGMASMMFELSNSDVEVAKSVPFSGNLQKEEIYRRLMARDLD